MIKPFNQALWSPYVRARGSGGACVLKPAARLNDLLDRGGA
jgi:hypothetical protein